MANIKISELPLASTPLSGTEEIPIVQNGQTVKAIVNDIKSYKVYTALLTQNGGSNPQTLNNSSLTVGVTYTIADISGGGTFLVGDFTNVGSPNNELGTTFVATGTTPNDWGTNCGLDYNTGTPVVTVLENTIGNIWWEYVSIGTYRCYSDSEFTLNKTYIDCKNVFGTQWDINVFEFYEESGFPNDFVILNFSNLLATSVNGIDKARIEARVYN